LKGALQVPLFSVSNLCNNNNIIPTTTTFASKPKPRDIDSVGIGDFSNAKMPHHRPETPQPGSPLPTEPDTSEGDGTADY